MIFYDFEVFKHDWIVVLINTVSKKETIIHNDPKELLYYFRDHEHTVWVGYNSNSYNKYILQAILSDYDPYEVSDFIINQNKFGWEFSKKLSEIQVNSYDTKVSALSLKQLQGYSGSSLQESSVPFDIKRPLTESELSEVITYCQYDVEQTMLVFSETVDRFNAYLVLINKFQLKLHHISKTTPQLAAVILKAWNSSHDDAHDVWSPFNAVIDKYSEVTHFFDRKKVLDENLTINIAGVEHTFGKGGVHGARQKYHYQRKEDELLILMDVNHLYPSVMVEYDLISRGAKLLSRYKWSVNESLRLKELGFKKQREPYKDFCNMVYGASGDYHNRLFDPRNRLLTCVFGQTFLLDLIEKIEPFATIIQTNTDGLLIKIKETDFDKLDEVVFEWEERTKLRMSFDYFDRIHQKDVNNYILIGEKIITAGAYVKDLNILDNDLPIVNRAVREYFVNDIPVERTILAADQLIDFQRVCRVTHKFDGAMYGKEKRHEKTFRVFADNNGKSLVRLKGNKTSKFELTPDTVRIVNDDIKNIPVPDWLNRNWYIELALKRVDDFLGSKKEDELKIEQVSFW